MNRGNKMNDSMLDKSATKRDLEKLGNELTDNLATKDELKKLELTTKEEFKKVATKEELKKLELTTKKEFKKVDKRINNLTQIIVQMQHQMTLLETKADAERKFNIIITMIDGLTQKVTDFQTEMRAGERTFQRHEDKLENHERRIESLEMNL